MAPGSPRVTRRNKPTARHEDISSDDGGDDSFGSSYHHAPYTRHDDSHYSQFNSSATSLHDRSRNDSSSYDPDKTTSCASYLSDSPSNKSFNSSRSSGSGIYPDLSKELSDSGDPGSFPRTRINKGQNKMYPSLESSSAEGIKKLGLIVLVVVFIFLALIYLVSSTSAPSSPTAPSPKSGYEYFEHEIKRLKSSFPNQTQRFWVTVSASARHVFEQQEPCYPSVILMATHNKNQKLNMCLASNIAAIFSASNGVHSSDSSVVSTDVDTFKHMGSDEQKLFLDGTLQTAFEQNGQKAFVISNIHSLSPKAGLLLHGFCDGDNAPYKDVMIILTFQVDDDTTFHSVKEVEGYLTNIWRRGLDMDKLSALMSRIANNQVVVMKESDDVLTKLCS